MEIAIRGQAWGYTGFAAVVRSTAFGLDNLGITVKIISTNTESPDEPCKDRDIIYRLLKNKVKNPIHISVGPPFILEPPKEVKYSIAYTMFEPLELPPDFTKYLDSFDEVWVPSKFNKKTFGKVYPEDNIHVIPIGINTKLYKPLRKSLNIMNPSGLRILMLGRWCTRKGFHIAIPSFLRAFKRDQATLMLATNFTDKTNILKMIRKFREKLHSDELPNIVFSLAKFHENVLPRLYNDCDVGLFPSLGEGYNLPAAEIMSCGKPVIVTEDSAMTDFCNEENGYLIKTDPQSKPIQDYGNMSVYYKGLPFQNPRLDSLIYTLQNIYADRETIIKKGKRARYTINKYFSSEVVSKLMVKRLEKIWHSK